MTDHRVEHLAGKKPLGVKVNGETYVLLAAAKDRIEALEYALEGMLFWAEGLPGTDPARDTLLHDAGQVLGRRRDD